MTNKKVLLIAAVALVVFAIYFLLADRQTTHEPSDELATCGGLAGFKCPSGYTCHLLNPSIADSLGQCDKN